MSGTSKPQPDERPSRKAVFERYYQKHFAPLVGFFCARGVPQEEAYELAQDVFLSAWKSLDRFRGDAHPRSWLFSIARNRFKNYLRRRKTLKRDAPEVSLESMREDLRSVPRRDLPEEPAALLGVLEHEERRVLAAGITALPDRMQTSLRMALGGDLTYREIGERLGIEENTVKSLTFQARKKLREFVAREAPELGIPAFSERDPDGEDGDSP